MLRPSFGCKHGKDPSPASNIQHDFVLEDVLVVIHGVPVGERPHFVLQHFLVLTCDKQYQDGFGTTGPLRRV